MTPLLAAALLSTIPLDVVARDRVCCLEVNHFCDSEAREVFVQFIAWEFHNGAHRVVDWRLVKQKESVANIQVQKDYATGDYLACWMDGDELREVRAKTYRETFSQHDPETLDREKHPQERRRKLSKPGKARVPE